MVIIQKIVFTILNPKLNRNQNDQTLELSISSNQFNDMTVSVNPNTQIIEQNLKD